MLSSAAPVRDSRCSKPAVLSRLLVLQGGQEAGGREGLLLAVFICTDALREGSWDRYFGEAPLGKLPQRGWFTSGVPLV